jgi:hypothetical protein
MNGIVDINRMKRNLRSLGCVGTHSTVIIVLTSSKTWRLGPNCAPKSPYQMGPIRLSLGLQATAMLCYSDSFLHLKATLFSMFELAYLCSIVSLHRTRALLDKTVFTGFSTVGFNLNLLT